MGFRPEPRTYRLVFTDPALAGLEVTMRSMSFGEYRDMLRLAVADGLTAETMAEDDKMVALFASRIVSWNLEDDAGQPVPATLEGARLQERWVISEIVTAWHQALVQVPPPLQNGSGSGVTLPEASLPMEPLSASQLS